jgi:DNA-binding protein HU-beta
MAKSADGPEKKKPMTKSLLAAKIAAAVGLSKKQVLQVLTAQTELAYKHAGDTFVIPGIGKLLLTESPAKRMIMPFGADKGKERLIPKRKKLKFRVAKAAKDAILGTGKK